MAPRAILSSLSKRYPKKRAFITGAGSGLGLAFAKELAANGWAVALTDLHPSRLEEAADIVTKAGGTAHTYQFDVTEYDPFNDAVQDFVGKTGGIDLGINNAGVGCSGFINKHSIELFRKVIDINVMGVAHGCHLFVPVMLEQKGGHILNVASAAAFSAAPRMAAYNASKAAVLALSETIHAELRGTGVFVSVLMPTFIRSNLGKDCLGAPEDAILAEMMVEKSPLTPEQVARETLLKVQEQLLYIVLPDEAVFLWRFKRFFPDHYLKFIVTESSRRERIVTRELEKRRRRQRMAEAKHQEMSRTS